MTDKYNRKIIDNRDNDIFIIFYSPTCPYCIKALDLLKATKKKYKCYNVKGEIEIVHKNLARMASTTGFDVYHRTIPIIFYKGKFIGGYDILTKFLTQMI
jgi:glutaredoxin